MMIEITIPGYGTLPLDHLVLDYNGTLACDGELLDGVKPSLERLAASLRVHVLTADTFGKAKSRLAGIPCDVSILPVDHQDRGKLAYVEKLGPWGCVAMGNGRNDHLMLKASALGIAVILAEGAAINTLTAADVVCTNIVSALQLLENPLRLTATLRS
jgi:soluble P-type ATPase